MMRDLPEFWPRDASVSLREGFGRVLSHLGERRDDFVLFDADVASGTGAKPYVERFPKRVFQFGTAEQNLVAAAAGFSTVGVIPVVTTFAVFGLMRAHEQFRTAVAYPRRNVKLCCSHLGIDVGPDGATAQMLEDLAIARSIPNLTVVVPADANALMVAFPQILDIEGPAYMRIGRSPGRVVYGGEEPLEVGRAFRLREGRDVTILAIGVMVARALEAAALLSSEHGISSEVIDAFTVKPLDEATIVESASRTGAVVTAEDHNVFGGLGGAVAECLSWRSPTPLESVGVMDRFGTSGDPQALAAHFGLDAESIVQAARRVVERSR